MNPMVRGIIILLSASVLLNLSACDKKIDSEPVVTQKPQPYIENQAQLKTSANGEEFSQYIKKLFKQSLNNDLSAFGESTGNFNAGSGATDLTALPTAGAAGGGAPTPVSSTNKVESGVDESDTVKTDGHYLYVLKERIYNYYYGLPVATIATADAVSVAPPYEPQKIRILRPVNGALGVEPVAEITLDVNINNVQGMYLVDQTPETPTADSLFVVSQGYQPQIVPNGSTQVKDGGVGGASFAPVPIYFGNPLTYVSAYDVTNPAQPTLKWSFSVEGYAIASRSLNNKIYLVSQKALWLYGLVANAKTATDTENNNAFIDGLSIDAILPKTYVNDELKTIVTVNDCMVPTTSNQNRFYSYQLLTMLAIPFSDPAQSSAVCTPESSDTVYVSPSAIYLTSGEYHTDVGFNTLIHKFNFVESGFAYAASGRVPGWVGWRNQAFRISEKQNYLRIVTTQFDRTAQKNVHRISVLKEDNVRIGNLAIVAQLPNETHPDAIGKPGEDIYSARFLGDFAYLVTFQKTDPLYVVNLVNPEAPFVEGELELPGYSDYLHPIGDNYLLGVGKDAIVEKGTAWYQGVKVGLFNVSDKTQPRLLGEVSIGKRGTDAAVSYDYKAFSFVHDTELGKYRISLPVRVHEESNLNDPASAPPSTYFGWTYSGTHLFEISAAAGAEPVLQQTGILRALTANNLQVDYGSNTRSVIVGDHLYYINRDRVWSSLWTEPENAVGPQ